MFVVRLIQLEIFSRTFKIIIPDNAVSLTFIYTAAVGYFIICFCYDSTGGEKDVVASGVTHFAFQRH